MSPVEAVSIPVALSPPQKSELLSHAQRNYVLFVIWIVLVMRCVDLQIIAVLLEPIKSEFKVSDTKMGLLSGSAFALFYAALGIPVAMLADRYKRRTIIASCLALWSAMTAMCGFTVSFSGLLLARVGVGVGEAGGAPPGYSLVSDYFPADRRSSIFALLNTSVPFGIFCNFIIGGYINARFGWRITLMGIGAFGLAVAALVRFTVREPRRGSADPGVAAAAPPMIETLRYLWAKRSYRHLVLATSIATLGAFGSGVWMLSFFVRVHHLQPAHVATLLAFIYGGGGIVGATLGGRFADLLSKRSGDRRWQNWLPGITVGSILPLSFLVYLAPGVATALGALIATVLLMHMWMGPAYGTIQSLARPGSRAVAAAVNMLFVNLLALGCGPLLVGAMSDFFNARFGQSAIRYSILVLVTVSYAWAAVHFLLASRTLRKDLQS